MCRNIKNHLKRYRGSKFFETEGAYVNVHVIWDFKGTSKTVQIKEEN